MFIMANSVNAMFLRRSKHWRLANIMQKYGHNKEGVVGITPSPRPSHKGRGIFLPLDGGGQEGMSLPEKSCILLRFKHSKRQSCMRPNVTLAMKFRRLRTAFHF